MRLFDIDRVGCYLDAITHRVEKTSDGDDVKMIDLTLRVQPLSVDLAGSLDPEVRALLFRLDDAEPKPKLKKVEFALTIPNQRLLVYAAPDIPDASMVLLDAEISSVRARTEKGVDGFALIFYVSVGPVDASQLEYVCRWHTEQRFVTFERQQPGFEFDDDRDEAAPPAAPARSRRSTATGQTAH